MVYALQEKTIVTSQKGKGQSVEKKDGFLKSKEGSIMGYSKLLR